MRSISNRSHEVLLKYLPELLGPYLSGSAPKTYNRARLVKQVWRTMRNNELKRQKRIENGKQREH